MMDEEAFKLAELSVGNYVKQAAEAQRTSKVEWKTLLRHRRIPEKGWSDARIEELLVALSAMDSNNFLNNVGAGEREARFASELVRRRHFGFGHGIGRSGDVSAVQPKAAGSSLLNILTEEMLLDLCRLSGITRVKRCLLLPVATGMAVVFTLLTLKSLRAPRARYVIWPRMDQKSCFKAILTAGLEPIIVPNCIEGDELRTDVKAIRLAIEGLGKSAILCVLTTTSCFAPRAPDRLAEVSLLCKELDVPHVVNNAYGLQDSKCTHLLNEAIRVGRLDACIQSTDKNLLVPVGGSIVASPDQQFISAISQFYPGRASGSPSLDVFITLLSLGRQGWKELLAQRKLVFIYLRKRIGDIAAKYGERLLNTSHNGISMAMTLSNMTKNDAGEEPTTDSETMLGSMLFSRCVSGTRVVTGREVKNVQGYEFTGFGAHTQAYPCTYITAAAAIGMTENDVDVFAMRLEKTCAEYTKYIKRRQKYKDCMIE